MSAAALDALPVPSITAQTLPPPITPHGPSHSTTGTTSNIAATMTTPGPSASSSSYRLLYRGAISLPDSLLLLDGLTFAARLGSPSKQSSFQLLDNPLALALESMRGRPTLRFVECVKLRDVYLDESGAVEMDIHPAATLSQIYFENMFCLLPFPSSSENPAKGERSGIGIRVALGDSNGPETTHIVIFAQLVSSLSSSEDSSTIRLRVGRITPKPLSPETQLKKRPPRPDDPIPRKPPAFFIRDSELKKAGSLSSVVGNGGVSGTREQLKRVASASGAAGVGPTKKQRLNNANSSGVAADLGSGVRLGAGMPDEGVFKVPELPKSHQIKARGGGKGKEKEKDVFGDVSEVDNQRVGVGHTNGKDKGKQKANANANDQDDAASATVAAAAFEKANKNLIKRATIEYLGRTKDPTDPTRVIDKTHEEFKDLYGFIYRGVGFALRAKMKTCEIDQGLVNHLIGMHALMYLTP